MEARPLKFLRGSFWMDVEIGNMYVPYDRERWESCKRMLKQCLLQLSSAVRDGDKCSADGIHECICEGLVSVGVLRTEDRGSSMHI